MENNSYLIIVNINYYKTVEFVLVGKNMNEVKNMFINFNKKLIGQSLNNRIEIIELE